ncbi:MAG: aminopeptidase P family protein [Deferribacterales bacterium]|nr:aminopeptidase P family protein [Deferribacterales bacterium]
MKVPAAELATRLKKFTNIMDMAFDGWRYVFIFNPVSAYYFTGTMQDGVLLIQPNDTPKYFIRRSVKRAQDESRFSEIIPIDSYSQMAEKLSVNKYSKIFIDKQFITMDIFERFNKYFGFENIEGCDRQLDQCRAVKSSFELNMIRRAGEIQRQILEEYMPQVLRPGMTEAEAASFLASELLRQGTQLVTRVRSFGRELLMGSVSFGVNSLKKFAFDGPGGAEGNCPAAPFLGSPHRILERDDLILIDICCGVEGYMADMTCVYSFKEVSDYVYSQQRRCGYIRDRAAEMLKPGITPESIYEYFINTLHPALEGVFMGEAPHNAKFLGHGIGLYVDEYPAIAKGFKEPLKENMVIALEPKAALKGIGMVGVENTYIVTPNGGESVNGENSEIIML